MTWFMRRDIFSAVATSDRVELLVPPDSNCCCTTFSCCSNSLARSFSRSSRKLSSNRLRSSARPKTATNRLLSFSAWRINRPMLAREDQPQPFRSPHCAEAGVAKPTIMQHVTSTPNDFSRQLRIIPTSFLLDDATVDSHRPPCFWQAPRQSDIALYAPDRAFTRTPPT